MKTLDGVESVAVDVQAGRAEVQYDPAKISGEVLKMRLPMQARSKVGLRYNSQKTCPEGQVFNIIFFLTYIEERRWLLWLL